MFENDEHEILTDDRQLGPYPDHLLKRVDKPTVEIPGPVERRYRSDNAAVRIRNGARGPDVAEKFGAVFTRYPLGQVIAEVRSRMSNLSPGDTGRVTDAAATTAAPGGSTAPDASAAARVPTAVKATGTPTAAAANTTAATGGSAAPDASAAARVPTAVKATGTPAAAAATTIAAPGGLAAPGARMPVKLAIPDDPKALSRNVKALAYFMGADAVGICQAPATSFFADDAQGKPYETKYKNAVVFLKRNDQATTMATNGQDMIVDATAQRTYLHLTMISEVVLSYIRMLGFGADSSDLAHSKNQNPSLIIASGLAESSRMGIALNPFFGADFKSSAILTDMPLLPDRPIDFGLQEYCSRCGICANQCIGGAISKGSKEIYNGYEKWVFDAEKCVVATANQEKGSNCFVCIMMCPWTRPETTPADFKSWDGNVDTLIAAADARADELRANGFIRSDAPGSKWWLDTADDTPIL